MSRDRKDLSLGELLRRGDPAAGEALGTDEIHAMRRAVLNAVPEPKRRSLLLPALAAAGVALLALGLLWLRAPVPGAEPPREASVAPPVLAPPPAPVAELPRAEVQPAVVVRHRKRPPVAVVAAAPVPIEEVGPALPHSRQIQFSTPGGTRVVWVLTTEDVL